MFAERLDSLMNIAEISNTMLGRAIHMNSSHIGRLRNGARPLAKKHEYITPMCQYITTRIQKEYQINALQRLTGIGDNVLISAPDTALYLENWLLAKDEDKSIVTGRLISGFSKVSLDEGMPLIDGSDVKFPIRYASFLHGNAGKRKAVEQFFLKILNEETPQTLLLFSDENMAWLYEDPGFAVNWGKLFRKVLLKGNKVRVIHNTSRDFNELIEAVIKWLPIYMTGMIEPYYYPRLRDDVFHRTLFIAPNTAAVVSSSIKQETDEMINFFITNRAAVKSLVKEYENYFSLCRPLMRTFTNGEVDEFHKDLSWLTRADGDASLFSAIPPLFAMSEDLVRQVSAQTSSRMLMPIWRKSVEVFESTIKKYSLKLTILNPEIAVTKPQILKAPIAEDFVNRDYKYSREQYLEHVKNLKTLETKYRNLEVSVSKDLDSNMILYTKEDIGVVMAKTDFPLTAFLISEKKMINAFWDYMNR